MQGIEVFIPTATKVDYLNKLLRVGFDTLDFGSFVSPKAIPQMRDTAEVLQGLHLTDAETRLLAIVANVRGAMGACQFDEITYLGFPLSLSETFQLRNTNRTIDEAFAIVQEIQAICVRANKQLVVYLSMGFGNPYGDPYSPEVVAAFIERLQTMGVRIISLADTVGIATASQVEIALRSSLEAFPDIEIGAHLHAAPNNVQSKLEAVLASGCHRVDGALRGFGGCPMAKDDLVGNMPTEQILKALGVEDIKRYHQGALEDALAASGDVFG